MVNKKEERAEIKKEIIEKLDGSYIKHKRTFGQKAADWLTKWAGSWTFIILLFTILIVWMIINGYLLIEYERGVPFDPYPFILLNLILSCLAAIQAPIILMSQNRQTQRDRLKAEFDYRINKKAEKEIQEIKKLLLKRKK
jgi:uncharacterized membrane protein